MDAAYQPMRALAYDAVQAIAAPASEKLINEPFEEIVGSMLPAGSRVLFVGHQDARDYSLFSPETRYSNAVIPWGTGPFDPERMGRMIASEKATHVLIQDDKQVFFEWFPTVDTREMVKWLSAQARRVKLPCVRTVAASCACASGLMATNKARPNCQPAIRLPANMR